MEALWLHSLDWSPKGYRPNCSHSFLPGLLLEPPKVAASSMVVASTPPSHHPVYSTQCAFPSTHVSGRDCCCLPLESLAGLVRPFVLCCSLALSSFECILQPHQDTCYDSTYPAFSPLTALLLVFLASPPPHAHVPAHSKGSCHVQRAARVEHLS